MHYATVSIMKSFESSIRSSLPLFLWPHWPSGAFFDLLLRLSQQFRFPTKPNPLANIVGEASPQGFQPHLDPTAQPKLTKPYFLFNPGVGKLCHPGALLVDLLRFGRLHLRFKRYQFSRLFHAYQRAPFFIFLTTLSLRRTATAICPSRPVAPFDRAPLSFLGFKAEQFACRTSVAVATRIIRESLGIKLRAYAMALQHGGLFSLRQWPDQINLLVRHFLNRVVCRIGTIDHHLLGLLPQVGLDSLYRRLQFPRVTATLGHAHSHNDLRLGIGGNLHVVARRITPFARQHHARLWVGATGPGWFLFSFGFFLRATLLKLLQLLKRMLESLLLLPKRSLFSLGRALTEWFGAGISHRFELLLSLLQMILKGSFAVKTLIRCRGLDLGSIVHHAPKRDQSLMAEHPQHLNEKPIERCLMRNAKIGQRVIIDHLHPRQPLIGRMILTAARNLSGHADAILIGIDPQTDQHLGVPGRSTRFPFQSANLGIESLQVHLARQLPDRSDRMVRPHQLFHIHRAQQQLSALDGLAAHPLLPVLVPRALQGFSVFHGTSATPEPIAPRPVLSAGSIYPRPPTQCFRLFPFLEPAPKERGKSGRTAAAHWPARSLGVWSGMPSKAPPASKMTEGIIAISLCQQLFSQFFFFFPPVEGA